MITTDTRIEGSVLTICHRISYLTLAICIHVSSAVMGTSGTKNDCVLHIGQSQVWVSISIYINSRTSAGLSLVFPENCPTDFFQTFAILFTLPLSGAVSISQTCGRVSLATKCEFWSKFACFGSFGGLFGYNFCLH